MTAETAARGMTADGLALTTSAVITAAAGMAGWVIAARVLSPTEVGDTSAFVSGFLLVAGIAELGLGPAFLRWLPRAGHHRRRLLGRGYLAVLAGSLAGSLLFVLVPSGADVVHRVPAGLALFVPAAVGWTLFQFQDSVLTGLGQARWVPVENGAFSVLRLGLLGALAPLVGALGLLLSWVVPTVLGVAVVSLLVYRRARPEPAPGVLPGRREIARLLAPAYPATLCVVVLYNLVPLIVLHRFGAAADAVFFVVWTGINALDVAATSFVNPLVVRLSTQPGQARALAGKAAVRILLVFTPALVVAGLLAGVLLALFGPDYAQGADLLRVLLAAQLPRLVVIVGVAVHLAAGRGLGVALPQAVTAAAAVVLASLMPSESAFGTGMFAVQAGLAAITLWQLRGRR